MARSSSGRRPADHRLALIIWFTAVVAGTRYFERISSAAFSMWLTSWRRVAPGHILILPISLIWGSAKS
jgi:hypothetical protein